MRRAVDRRAVDRRAVDRHDTRSQTDRVPYVESTPPDADSSQWLAVALMVAVAVAVGWLWVPIMIAVTLVVVVWLRLHCASAAHQISQEPCVACLRADDSCGELGHPQREVWDLQQWYATHTP